MRTSKIALLVIFIGCISFQCSKPQATVRQIQNGIILETANLNLKVQYYSDNIIRIVKWLPGGTPEKLSLIVLPREIPDLPVQFQDGKNYILLTGSRIKLEIAKRSGAVQYLTSSGETILAENSCTFKPLTYVGDAAFQIQQNFKLTPEEGIYGLGQHQDGYMNYRGKTVKLVQSNTDAVTPFLVSTQGFGILWDNYSKTVFSDGEKGAYLWSDVGDNIDY
jgi:alpha-D-xyloside xylohydrolase